MTKKIIYLFSILSLFIITSGCGQNKKDSTSNESKLSSEDSAIMARLDATEKRLEPFQKVREDFIGPTSTGNPELTRGGEISGNAIPSQYSNAVDAVDAWKKVISDASLDSTTEIGPMMSRGKLLDASQKFLHADYDRNAHVVHYYDHYDVGNTRYDEDFYFKNSELLFYEHKISEHKGDNVHLIQDDFYLKDGKVIYGFRDEGTSKATNKSLNFVDVLRYQLNGDKTAHVAKAFADFQEAYKILLAEKLDANIYIK